MTKAEQAALDAARGVVTPPDVVEGEPPAPSGDASAAEEPVVQAPEEAFTGFTEPEVPEDLLEFLALEDEVEDVALDDDEDDDIDLDELHPRLAKELKKAQKEAAFYKERVVKASRSKWEDEAKRFFPLSEQVLPQIQADSRRSFLRQAQAAHETVLPFVKTAVAAVEAERQAAIEQARQEAREEARQQWGVPRDGPPNEVPDEAEREQRITRARQNGDLAATIKAMVFPTRRES